MTGLSDLMDLLNKDLANEYKHFHFYVNAAMRVQGINRNHLKSWLVAEAKSEMEHILKFGNLITGLGGVPSTKVNGFRSDLTDARQILEYALSMEEEVVANYVERKSQAQKVGGIAGARIEVFIDEQIVASADDADHIRQMLAGM